MTSSNKVIGLDFSKLSSNTNFKNGFKQFVNLVGSLEIKEFKYKFEQEDEQTIAYYVTRSDGLSVILNAISGTVETMRLEDWLIRFYSRIDLTN